MHGLTESKKKQMAQERLKRRKPMDSRRTTRMGKGELVSDKDKDKEKDKDNTDKNEKVEELVGIRQIERESDFYVQ